MPNQPVTCPHCGSPTCVEYRPDSFVCNHCESKFRWVDPTRLTLEVRHATCLCGRNARAICQACGRPICAEHEVVCDFDRLLIVPPQDPAARYSSYLRPLAHAVFDRIGLAGLGDEQILCRVCCEQFGRRFADEIGALVREAVRQGKACACCGAGLSRRMGSSPPCAVCGAAYCRKHRADHFHDTVCKHCPRQ